MAGIAEMAGVAEMAEVIQMTEVTASERAALLDVARDLAGKELAPRSVQLDQGDPAAIADCLRRLADIGLERALLPAEHGGAGLGTGDLLAVIEELATGEGGVALSVLLANAALTALGPEQAAALDPGERWVLVPARLETDVTVSAGRVDGRIETALGAYGADGLVLAVSGPDPVTTAVTIAVTTAAKGVTLRRDETQMGLRAATAASVHFTGVDIGADNSAGIGADDSVDDSADDTADAGGENADADSAAGVMAGSAAAAELLWAGTAAVARGIMRSAYEMALEYAENRRQGGRAIVDHDAVADLLSAMAVRLAYPLPPNAGMAAALAAKIAAADAAVATTTDAVQVFGGTGYMYETGVEKLMRDAKYCQLFPKPSWVARDEVLRLERHSRGRRLDPMKRQVEQEP